MSNPNDSCTTLRNLGTLASRAMPLAPIANRCGRLVGLVLLLVAPFTARGEDGREATQRLIERTVSRGIEILQDGTLDDAARLASFDDLLDEVCDLELMARLTLGRNGWAAFNREERREFTFSFRDLLKHSYYGKLAQQDATNFSVDYTANRKVSDTRRELAAVMRGGAYRFEVLYKFYLRDGKWLIYDIEVDGISLIASYRAQFADFLARRSPSDLLAELRRPESQFLPDDVPPPQEGN